MRYKLIDSCVLAMIAGESVLVTIHTSGFSFPIILDSASASLCMKIRDGKELDDLETVVETIAKSLDESKASVFMKNMERLLRMKVIYEVN